MHGWPVRSLLPMTRISAFTGNACTQGTDVIEYYAKFGHDAKVKMFHCIKANPHGAGSPYDLLVLAKEALPPPRAGSSYYTMSASGVVQVGRSGWGPEGVGHGDVFLQRALLPHRPDRHVPAFARRSLRTGRQRSTRPLASGSVRRPCTT